jgi:hypothetical protein
MPYKDPQKKRERMQEWRERHSTPEYNRWLYQRRKMWQDATFAMHETLATIAGSSQEPIAQREATEVLAWFENFRREVGNRYDHQNNKPYYEEGKE